MKSKIIISIWMMLIPLVFTQAQPVTMNLWPEGIPGSKPAKGYLESTTGGTPDQIMLVSKVSEPDLTIFLPKTGTGNGMAVLIIPGGGYGIVAIDHEGYAIAKWLNQQGIAGIVLKYRLPSDEIMENKSIGPLQDAQEAMRVIRRNASAWKLNINKIGVIGFSAGGHLASTLSTHYLEKTYPAKDTLSARPDFSILIYPVITFDESFTHLGSRINLIGEKPIKEMINKFSNELQVNESTPPAFLVHSADDDVVPVQNSLVYFQALQKYHIPSELHIFKKGGHGYGLATKGSTESSWPGLCIQWLNTLN